MSEFAAKRFVRKFSYHIDAGPEEIFPLLCPVREYDWIDGWACEMVYSDSGVAENNCIFKTQFQGHGEEIWTVSRHDKENFIIEFAIVYPGVAAEKLDVSLKAGGEEGTAIRWTRTYTGLSPEGNQALEHLTGGFLDERMGWLNDSLNHYLKTGEKLKRKQDHS